MKLTKDEALKKIEELKEYVADFDKKPEMAIEPDWGYKADLTEEFLAQTMNINGVKYHRHRYGGGWVSEKAQVDETVWVGVFAVVHNGVVKDQVVIHDRAVVDCDGQQNGDYNDFNVGDSAQVTGSAWVGGSARVGDSAQVTGSAWVCDSAEVADSAQVTGSAWVRDSAEVAGSAQVTGSARVSDSAQVSGSAWVCGSARVSGSAQVTGSARVGGQGYLKKHTNQDIELKDWETVK